MLEMQARKGALARKILSAEEGPPPNRRGPPVGVGTVIGVPTTSAQADGPIRANFIPDTALNRSDRLIAGRWSLTSKSVPLWKTYSKGPASRRFAKLVKEAPHQTQVRWTAIRWRKHRQQPIVHALGQENLRIATPLRFCAKDFVDGGHLRLVRRRPRVFVCIEKHENPLKKNQAPRCYVGPAFQRHRYATLKIRSDGDWITP